MPELTLRDIDRIRKDVMASEICYSHLADELIDHLCCDVEYEMAGGLSFRDAYMRVRASVGQRRLREIQEETLYAVDTKYRNMKNTMKISAIAGTGMLGFAALFKIMHWPWAGILSTLGGILLAFVFIPSALTVLWKETRSRKKLFLYITAFLAGLFFIGGVIFKIQHWPLASFYLMLAGVSGVFLFLPALVSDMARDGQESKGKLLSVLFGVFLGLYMLGALFKIQHWPNSFLLMIAGLAGLFFIVLPLYVRQTWKETRAVSARFIFLITGSLALVVPSMLITLNLERNFDSGFGVMLDSQQALFRYRSAENVSLVSGNTDTTKTLLLSDIELKTGQLISVINNIEEKMISESEGEPGRPVVLTNQVTKTGNGIGINFNALNKPFHLSPYDDHLLQGTISRNELDNALREYSGFLLILDTETDLTAEAKVLDPSEWFPGLEEQDGKVPLISALHLLELMKNTVLVAEAHAIKAILENQIKQN